MPVIELKLFESALAGEASLAQFNDEVVVTQPIDADLLPHLDVIFFSGEDGDLMNRLAIEAAEADVLTFVEGAVGLDAPVMIPGSRGLPAEALAPGGLPAEALAKAGLVIVPRMASYLVGVVLERASAALGSLHASATVLVPAAHRGAQGADELHQQVVSLLSFKPLPMEVFNEQLAFNANVAHAGAKAAALAEAVAKEASGLAGSGASVTVNLVQVPVFHAYCASMWIELDAPVEPKTLASAFREPPFTIDTARNARSPSPLSVAESSRIHVGGLRPSMEASRPGFWLWAVADTTAFDPALAAVELAKAALG